MAQFNNSNSIINNGEVHHSNLRHLPRRIILVRHGESAANIDEQVYGNTPDHRISLSIDGIEQAREAGRKILDMVNSSGNNNWNAYFYVSPYQRTKSTLREIGRAFPRNRVAGVREECRIREQDFGNFQDKAEMKKLKEDRDRYGRFFYRFPSGESGSDVYDRVSSFLESLWRDIDMNRLSIDPSAELNIVIVSHGLSIRVFLMRWFKWSAEQFDALKSPKNCEIRVLELGSSGEYSLAIQHDDQTLQGWGLSPEMIDDQKQRANAKPGKYVWKERSPWYLNTFFDSVDSSDQVDGEKVDQP
ncbi:OLC1v1000561C1 [Oldenlandia corymbosa var. corymbosa]|uniref:OLC1v1000561C1 n=1 Tax=Oldenlandia corymbosa var. corymbosa TaxID=529605 RepID=A0AAV1D5D8_OLDCO|nr:OLC1v1000561C1 [Oldenlandia corymbosa var. corymbosa]